MRKILLSIAALVSLNVFATEELSVRPTSPAKKQFVIQANVLRAITGEFGAEVTYLVNKNIAVGVVGSYSKTPQFLTDFVQERVSKQDPSKAINFPADAGMIEVGAQAKYFFNSNQKDGIFLNLNPSYRTGTQKLLTTEGTLPFSENVSIVKIKGAVGYQSVFKNGLILSSELGAAYNHYLGNPIVKRNIVAFTSGKTKDYKAPTIQFDHKLLSIGMMF